MCANICGCFLCHRRRCLFALLFVFDSVGGLGVDLVDHVNCLYTPAPMELLRDALDGGCGVVIMVDHHPGHWLQQAIQRPGCWRWLGQARYRLDGGHQCASLAHAAAAKTTLGSLQ